MKQIKVQLSAMSLAGAVASLESYKSEIAQALQEGVQEVVEESVEIVRETMALNDRNDTFELSNSTQAHHEKNKSTLTQEGANAFPVEFGDGIYYTPSAYPDSSVIPSGVPKHSGLYHYYPKPNTTRWLPSEKRHSARGQYPTAQMYSGAKYIRENLAESVKNKLK